MGDLVRSPYSVVPDDEMLMALFPDYLPNAIAGNEAPAKTDCATRFRDTASSRLCAGMAVSYPGRAG